MLAAGSALVAACGSTVAPAAQGPGTGGTLDSGGIAAPGAPAAPGSPGADGTGGQVLTPGGAVSGGTTGAGSAGTTGAGSAGTTGGTAAGGSTGGAAPAAGGSGAVGPGVTATEIKLGLPYCSDCAAANAALGAGSEDPGDTRRYMQAALDEVNARGGLLGRKLVPVWHEVSASDNIEASQQAACETFTKDNKVLAIFFRGEIIYECAKRAGIITTGGGSGPVFERYPNLFSPAGIRLERLAAATVKAMVKSGWHKPDTKWPTGKIGIVSWDNPDYRYAMSKGWLPAMKAAGLPDPMVRWVAIPQSDRGIADAGPAISSAVLAFRQAGIDHVFISDGPAGIFTGAGLTLLFLQNAKSQQYYPRYGFNSNNSPDFESHPKDQLAGMIAIDSFSTADANDEGIPKNPQRVRCFEVMRKKGLRVGAWQTQAVAIGACDIAWFTEAIVKKARSTLLPDMIAGGEALGTSYRSPYSYGNRLGPGQHDGTALFRNLQWDNGCSCLKYTSKPYEP